MEISILMCKYYSGQMPHILKQLFKSDHMVHSYGTRHRHNCHIPHKSSRLGQYSLSFQGPKIWNSIDKKTKDIKLIFSFKKCIKQKFYRSRAMTVVTNNSPIYKFFTLYCFYNVYHYCYLQLNCKTSIQPKVMLCNGR